MSHIALFHIRVWLVNWREFANTFSNHSTAKFGTKKPKMAAVWITLYSELNFGGNSQTYYSNNGDVTGDFENGALSAKFAIGKSDETVTLYRDVNWKEPLSTLNPGGEGSFPGGIKSFRFTFPDV